MWNVVPPYNLFFQRLSGKSECEYLKLNEGEDIFARLKVFKRRYPKMKLKA